MSGFLKMKGTSFVFDSFEDLVDVVVHCRHSMESFFGGGRREFAVIVKVYGMWITAMETSV